MKYLLSSFLTHFPYSTLGFIFWIFIFLFPLVQSSHANDVADRGDSPQISTNAFSLGGSHDVSSGGRVLASIEHSQSVIERIESQQGAYGNDLSQELLSIGLTYQKHGKHNEAIKALKRALHLKRINEGLYSTTQIPIIKKLIDSLSVKNKWALVDNRYAYLKWLYAQNYEPEAIETLSINLLMAKWYLKSYSLQRLEKPIVDLMNSYSAYSRALNFMNKQYGEVDYRLISTLHNITLVNYLIAVSYMPDESTYVTNDRGMSNQSNSFSSGNQVTSNIVVIKKENQVNKKVKHLKYLSFKTGVSFIKKELGIYQKQKIINHLKIVNTKLKLADWYLMYGKREAAMLLYQQAYLYLKSNEKSSKIVNEIFGQPISLPNFPNMKSNASTKPPSKKSSEKENYVLASMDITRFGKAENIEIVSTNPESKSARIKVIKSLRGAQFRPKFTDGNSILVEKVKLHIFL
jgi:tetratricopeptide (TPR) repeat protein